MPKNQLTQKFKLIFSKCFSIILIIILWEIGAKLELFKPNYFPPPSAVFLRLFYLLTLNNAFILDIKASYYRYFMAAIIGIPPAIILGILIGLNKYISLFFRPIVAMIYPIPKLALLPMLFLIFGIDDVSKIVLIILGTSFLVLINTVYGIERLKASNYIDILKIYKIPFIKRLLSFYLRGALPEILTGIKVGLGHGLVMIVASEFTASKNGIGLFTWIAWDQFRVVDMYCGLYILSFSGIIVFYVLERIISNLKEFKNSTH